MDGDTDAEHGNVTAVWTVRRASGRRHPGDPADGPCPNFSISIIPRYRVFAPPVFGSPRTPVDGTGVRTLNAVILGHRLARKTHQQTSPESRRLMGPPRSTYYDAPSVKTFNAEIVANITAICDEFEAYGYRRVGAELRHRGMKGGGPRRKSD